MNLTGSSIPSFTLADQEAKTWTEGDLKDTWTILYAYPKDMTPGCTLEAHDFTAQLKDFEKAGAQVLGISPDDEKSHQKFCQKDGITYPLLSDPEKKLLQALGCWVEKSMVGKKYMGVERSTWVVDPKGMIVQEWHKVNVPGHVKEVLDTLKQFQEK